MKVFVAGASGFIGRAICLGLFRDGHEALALSRDRYRARVALGENLDLVLGDPTVGGEWMQSVDGCDAVINLAGEPIVGKRWTEEFKRLARDSRVRSTQNMVEAIARAKKPPAVLLNASAVGYYGPSDMRELDEDAPAGASFLARLCAEWEEAALKAGESGVRVVRMRIGVALHRDGGALAPMTRAFKWGLGGPLGAGRQPFPWIHRDDVVGAALHILEHTDLSAAVNFTAPECVTDRDFAKALGRALHRPAFLPAPEFALRLLFGEGADVLLTGQNAAPQRLQNMGYTFKYPTLDSALKAEFPK